MESYPAVAPLWDLSQVSSFSQLPDDDFLALLHKQFSANNNDGGFDPGVFDTGINPQSIQSLEGPSPPSDDSSPSPASPNNDSSSRGDSRRPRADTDGDDSILKRKASDDSMDNGPNQKNQHTVGSKGSTSNRRKSSGGNPDDSRLLKRKEQNRAAQRAFRERKEKHVKDLEDKVAALEAKNELAVSENVNLRDLLVRLQDENVSLKQAAFTFSVPKTAGSDQPVASGSGQSSLNSHTSITTSPISPYSTAPAIASPDTFISPETMDWTSLTTFDPAVLSLLDDNVSQTTATNSALDMDFGFGDHPNKSPFTTIAANPMLMSFADFDSPDLSSSDTNSINSFNFDMWGSSPQSDVATTLTEPGLDELFGGNYLNAQSPIDLNTLMKGSPSLSDSPVSHPSPSSGTSGSSASSNSNKSEGQSPISSVGSAEPEQAQMQTQLHGPQCPKTRAEVTKFIEAAGPSVFAKDAVHKPREPLLDKIVPCRRSGGIPRTEPRDDNVEVLTAWRDVTSLPNFKDVDINELCSEFSSKARCDGSRVVLEHPTYQNILAKLGQSQRQ